MPPKVDVKTLTGKMNNAVGILHELMEEFEAIFAVKPGRERNASLRKCEPTAFFYPQGQEKFAFVEVYSII